MAQAVDVRAYVDRTVISIGESLQLTVAISDGDGTVDISAIQDFKVLSKGSGTSINIINNQVSKETTYQYTLIPTKEGNLIIPALAVYSNGRTYHTQEISITVSKSAVSDGSSSFVFVEGTVSKSSIYEGEHFIYTFRLYNAVQIANARFQRPGFSGFTSKEIEDRKSYRKVINGREFNVTEVNFVLIPIKPGEIIIEPSILECDLVRRRPSSRISPFDSFFNDSFFGQTDLQHRVYQTEPIAITVNPLPPYTDGKFSGLVGKFRIQTEIDHSTLKIGDSATLSVIIEGTGNIMDADEPSVTIPDAFKVYKDAPREDIKLDMNGYNGKKIYQSALVALTEGNYIINPISFTYFDIENGQYQTLKTEPIAISVHPSEKKDNLQVFSSPSEQLPSLKKKVEFTGRDILPIKDDLDSIKNKSILSFGWFMICIAIPAIICIGIILSMSFFKKVDDPSIIMAKRAERALQEASNASEDMFFSCLYRALVSQILSNAGMKGESLTYTEAQQILQRKGYPEETIKRVIHLLEKIESAIFGGPEVKKTVKEDLLSETRQVIKTISKKRN